MSRRVEPQGVQGIIAQARSRDPHEHGRAAIPTIPTAVLHSALSAAEIDEVGEEVPKLMDGRHRVYHW